MKKIATLTMAFIMLLSLLTFDASAQETASVYLNGYTMLNTPISKTLNGAVWSGSMWSHINDSYPCVCYLMPDNKEDCRTIVLINYFENENSTSNSTNSKNENKNNEKIKNIESEINKANKYIKDIQSDIKSYKKNISNIEKEISTLNKTLKNVSQEKNVRVFKNGSWVWEADSSSTQYIQNEIDELELELELYEDLLDEAESTLEELEDAKDELERELASLK